MKKVTLFSCVFGVLVFVTAVWREQRASTKEALHSLQAEMQELRAQVAELEQSQQRSITLPQVSAEKKDDTVELTRLRTEVAQLRDALAHLERAGAAISNEIATARGANIPFVYPDSTKRTDYVFTGYSTPQYGFQSVLWAIRQTDARTFLQSLTGLMAETFAPEFKDLPGGVMPGGFRNGDMFQATGFRVIEESPVSDDEMLLKVFLEGSNVMIKPVFKRVGGEWKWARWARNQH
jgi:hypothetical protein